MKFSDVAKGTAATRPTSFRYEGTEVPVLIRPLNVLEEISVIVQATSACEKDGVREAKPGDPIYDSHLMAHTVALTCMDPDSAGHTSPTFDRGPTQVLELDSDTVLMLYEQQRMWQEECSPSIRTKTTTELFALAKEVAESEDPFVYAKLSLLTRWQLQHFTAALLHKSPAFRGLSSSS